MYYNFPNLNLSQTVDVKLLKVIDRIKGSQSTRSGLQQSILP